MRTKLLTLTIIWTLCLWLGCSASRSGWQPATETEFRQVVGETMVQAIHQYRMVQMNHIPLHTIPHGRGPD